MPTSHALAIGFAVCCVLAYSLEKTIPGCSLDKKLAKALALKKPFFVNSGLFSPLIFCFSAWRKRNTFSGKH